MKTQGNAVFAAVCAVLGKSEEQLKGVKVLDTITKEQRQQVHAHIIEQFMAGDVALDEPEGPGTKRNREWLSKYVGGLTNNWLRKDPRLNGGGKYVAKNPGSRTGAGDEQLQMMQALLKVTTDSKDRRDIEAAIAARKQELAPKPVTIDPNKLPEALRHLVKQPAAPSAEA
jgi:hypothetical protein